MTVIKVAALALIAGILAAQAPRANGITKGGGCKAAIPQLQLYSPLPEGTFYVSSGFGKRLNPIEGGTDQQAHNGVDLAAVVGVPIRAPADGQVEVSGYFDREGWFIRIRHADGIVTKFAHCSRLVATAGARVKQGEVVAYVGKSGHATGPHAHYIIERNGLLLDPAKVCHHTEASSCDCYYFPPPKEVSRAIR